MQWSRWLPSRPAGESSPESEPLAIEDIRLRILESLHDCSSDASLNVRWKLQRAQSAQDLWLLRGEVFQLLACAHCETQAAHRINELLPAFEGWLPARSLTRI